MGISGNAVPSKNGKRRKVIYRRNIFSLNTQTVRFRVTNIKEKKTEETLKQGKLSGIKNSIK